MLSSHGMHERNIVDYSNAIHPFFYKHFSSIII